MKKSYKVIFLSSTQSCTFPFEIKIFDELIMLSPGVNITAGSNGVTDILK